LVSRVPARWRGGEWYV